MSRPVSGSIGCVMLTGLYIGIWIPLMLGFEPTLTNALLLLLPGAGLLVWAVSIISNFLERGE